MVIVDEVALTRLADRVDQFSRLGHVCDNRCCETRTSRPLTNNRSLIADTGREVKFIDKDSSQRQCGNERECKRFRYLVAQPRTKSGFGCKRAGKSPRTFLFTRSFSAFQEELQKLGWTEGQNIRIETRWALPRDGVLRQRFAKELIGLNPDLILSHATPSTATLAEQSRTIPIIFVGVSDPVGSGFVASFARPGGNITGFITMEPTMAGEWLELLKEIAPRISRVAFLFNPATAPYVKYYLNPFKAAAESLGMEVIAAPVRNTSDLETAIAAQASEPNAGLIAMPDTFLNAHRMQTTMLAARYGLPAVYAFRFFTEHGGLLSYGIDLVEQYRQAASYADRILNGARPSELPVQTPVKFELAINLKTAKALGLTVPPTLLARADEVIE
jgi:putative ABC transport system substrate-binding protein